MALSAEQAAALGLPAEGPSSTALHPDDAAKLGLPPNGPEAEPSPHQKLVHAIGGLIPKARYSDGSEESDAEHDASTGGAVDLATGLTMPEIPGVAKAAGWVAGKVGGGLKSAANSLAARMLKGTADEYRSMGPEGVQKLGDFLLRKSTVTFGPGPSTVAERAAALPEQTGKALGSAVEALDATGSKVSKGALANEFDSLALDAAQKGPAAAPLVAKYKAAAQAVRDDIAATGESSMSFADAEKWKQGYQDPINYAKRNKTPINMGDEAVAGKSRQLVEDAAGVAAENPGADPALADNFIHAKQESGLAQQAAKMAAGAEGRSEARGLVGPVAKAASWGTAGLMAAHGNIPGAAAALVAGPAMQAVAARAPGAAAVGLNAAASGMEKLQAIVASNPGSLGRYGVILAKATAEGPQSFAAHTYALSQTDPGFQDLQRQLAENHK